MINRYQCAVINKNLNFVTLKIMQTIAFKKKLQNTISQDSNRLNFLLVIDRLKIFNTHKFLFLLITYFQNNMAKQFYISTQIDKNSKLETSEYIQIYGHNKTYYCCSRNCIVDRFKSDSHQYYTTRHIPARQNIVNVACKL